MTRHDPRVCEAFIKDMEEVLDEEEHVFQNAVNKTVLVVEKDERYSTSEKLKIYARLSGLCNCEKKERLKWVKKAARSLK